MPCQGLKGRNSDSRKVGMRLEIVRMHTFKCTYKGRKEFRRGMCQTTICQGSKAETSYTTRQGARQTETFEPNPCEFTAFAQVH